MIKENLMRLTLAVAEAQAVRVEAPGCRVAAVLRGTVRAGTTNLVFDGPALPAGPCLLRAPGGTFTTPLRLSIAR